MGGPTGHSHGGRVAQAAFWPFLKMDQNHALMLERTYRRHYNPTTRQPQRGYLITQHHRVVDAASPIGEECPR